MARKSEGKREGREKERLRICEMFGRERVLDMHPAELNCICTLEQEEDIRCGDLKR